MKIGKTIKEMFPNSWMYDMDFPDSYTNGMRTPIYRNLLGDGITYYFYKSKYYTAHEYFDILKLN